MDAVPALLRAAIRIAQATAAVVAFDDDGIPMAFTGCSQTAAVQAMRDGSGAHVDCHGARPMTLVLIQPQRSTSANDALGSIASAGTNSHSCCTSVRPPTRGAWPTRSARR